VIGLTVHRFVDAIDSLVPSVVKGRLKKVWPGLDRRIYAALRSATSSEIVPVRIKGGLLAGRTFCCSMRDERDYWLGIHEPGVQAAVAANLRPGDVFFDVGVHKGFFSLIGAACVGDAGLVVGFEPNPENRKWIARNLSLNADLMNRVLLESLAVSDRTGTQTFVGSPGSAVGRLLSDDKREESETIDVTVQTVSIDDYVARGHRPPTLIKMDIEGGETAALRGLSRTLTTHRPTVIIEVHNEKAAVELALALTRYDYDCLDPDGRSADVGTTFQHRDQFVLRPRNGSGRSGTNFPATR
jgi:FkbM family methyltransferase